MILPVIPHSSYRERSSRLKQLDDDKNALIDVSAQTLSMKPTKPFKGARFEARIKSAATAPIPT